MTAATASCGDSTDTLTAQNKIWVVGVQKIQYKKAGVWVDVPGTLYVLKGSIVEFKAFKNPSGASEWPSGQPVWSGEASGTDTETTSVSFPDISESASDYKKVKASCGNDDAYNKSVNVIVYDAEMTTPAKSPPGDPVESPTTSGDGQNEFSYSSGSLSMNLKAKVIPDGIASSVKDDLSFSVPDIGDASATPETMTVSGNYLETTATYDNLPEDNSDFGDKTVALKHGETEVSTADCEVFFEPEQDSYELILPGWYYYWKQGVILGLGDLSYNPYLTLDGEEVKGFTSYDGDMEIDDSAYFNGLIESVASVVLHEKRHQELILSLNSERDALQAIFDEQWGEDDGTPEWEDAAIDLDTALGDLDSDSDHILDSEEPGLGLDPTTPDTHSLGYAHDADNEHLALQAGNDEDMIDDIVQEGLDWSKREFNSNW